MPGIKVYESGGFVVYKGNREHTIHNTALPFSDGHCHGIVSLKTCMTIIENLVHKKIPQTHCAYLLESHIRLTDDDEYRARLEQLKVTRQLRRSIYINPHKKKGGAR